jgi:hypothetical protein
LTGDLEMVQKTEQQNKIEQYFEQNSKFFGSGDINGKRAFFCLGQYTRRVMEAEEKSIAESGEESKFQKRLTREISNNMSYRAFTIVLKLLDNYTLKNPELSKCSGACKQYIINSEVTSDKKALRTEDANLAFSLGVHQKF